MKLLLILALLFSSCQMNNKDVNSEENTQKEPLEWVTYKAKNNQKGKHIVLVSGDEEYRSEEALPQLAQILTQHHGFDCTVLFAQNPEKPGYIDPNYSFNIPGLEQLKKADLMILFTRFRALPSEQMQHIENYLSEGNPLIAIRTATHAFRYKDANHPFSHYGFNYRGEKADWSLGFGKLILGETWHTHHGNHKHQSTRGIIAESAENHPVLNGIEDGSIWGPSDVYGIRMPMEGDAQSIVLGQTIDRVGEYDETDVFFGLKESDDLIATKSNQGNPNENMPPIVWTKSYQIPNGKTGQSLTSTIGAAADMMDEEVRRLFVNSTYHLLEMEVPEKAKVDFIGKYSPSAFQFHDDEYWIKKGLKVSDLVEYYEE
ncbi:MAG: hypothetical protein P1U70_00790 [Saprospiraceae bacterium]|jgi:hypothetical protein|nr:hypothetical protein [Saprospiraceae bacterium]